MNSFGNGSGSNGPESAQTGEKSGAQTGPQTGPETGAQSGLASRSTGACLLLHGFSGTPYEMEPLARAMQEVGVDCRAPLLPGHGTNLVDLDRHAFQDWYAAAESHYNELAAEHGQVFVIGQSMGGSLALRLAEMHRPAGVVCIAAAVFLYRLLPPRMRDWRLPLVPLLKMVRPIWPTAPRSENSRAMAPWEGYEGGVALNALASFMTGLAQVRQDLPRVTAPLLCLHAPGDKSVDVANSREIMSRAGSLDKRLELLNIQESRTSRHLLTTHRETAWRVAMLTRDFVLARLHPGAAQQG